MLPASLLLNGRMITVGGNSSIVYQNSSYSRSPMPGAAARQVWGEKYSENDFSDLRREVSRFARPRAAAMPRAAWARSMPTSQSSAFRAEYNLMLSEVN